jgi:hypothetical protein
MGCVWVFSAPNIEEQAKRLAVVSPFATIPIAIITFCTVAWRGLVTEQQADEQRRQNEATNDANFAKLLQEGTKLLADDKPTNQQAGVASLSILLNEPKARYRTEAMDVLAEAVRSMFAEQFNPVEVGKINSSSLFRSINVQLAKQAALGIFSNAVIQCHASEKDDPHRNTIWPMISGFASCHIQGGRILHNPKNYVIANKSMSFTSLDIYRQEVDTRETLLWSCTFEKCRILAVDDFSVSLFSNKFIDCDFSGCVLDDDVMPVFFQSDEVVNPWYDVRNPPITHNGRDFSRALDARLKTGFGWTSLTELTAEDENLTEEEINIINAYNAPQSH